MIADLDDALKQLLIQKTPLDATQVDIAFEVPDREWSAGLAKPTLDLYLYDIRENLELRETDWTVQRRDGKGIGHKLLPLRIDLAYLITAWTRAVEDEHRLLWQALSTCCRHPELPEELLLGELKGQNRPVRITTARSDGALKDPADFWAALDNQPKPSVNLVVTVELDTAALVTAPTVTEVKINMETLRPRARRARAGIEEAVPQVGAASRTHTSGPGVRSEEVAKNHLPPEVTASQPRNSSKADS